jgi:hypothetical protein
MFLLLAETLFWTHVQDFLLMSPLLGLHQHTAGFVQEKLLLPALFWTVQVMLLLDLHQHTIGYTSMVFPLFFLRSPQSNSL